jgi:phage-related protein
MALDTFVPPVRQSPGTKIKPTVKIKKAEFGDGYTQKMPDGLNHIRDGVTLTWDTLLPEQAKDMELFMKQKLGTIPFLYDVDEGEFVRWTCEIWERGRGDQHTFTATFEQYFGPAI